MCFGHKMEFPQEVLRPLRTFDVYGSGRVTQLNLHEGMISRYGVEGKVEKCYEALDRRFAQKFCRLFR